MGSTDNFDLSEKLSSVHRHFLNANSKVEYYFVQILFIKQLFKKEVIQINLHNTEKSW